jgi:hypothetical protein
MMMILHHVLAVLLKQALKNLMATVQRIWTGARSQFGRRARVGGQRYLVLRSRRLLLPAIGVITPIYKASHAQSV